MLNSDSFRTWITCASYALIHVIENKEIDVVELENSTGVPFGVASYSDQYHCTRMLTPYRAFWDGIDSIQRVWGIRLEHKSTPDSFQLLSFIHSIGEQNFLLGPINMSALYYLPLSSQYKCADHYVALHLKENGMYLIDSEGIPYMRISDEDLKRILSISEILEARELFHVGYVLQTSMLPSKEERLYETVKIAENCFKAAEENGQGGKAFLLCKRVMKELPASRWVASIRYDLSYYMQRKYMLLMMDQEGIFLSSAFKEHIREQIHNVSKTLHFLSERSYSKAIIEMEALSEKETIIPYRWKEWVTQL